MMKEGSRVRKGISSGLGQTKARCDTGSGWKVWLESIMRNRLERKNRI